MGSEMCIRDRCISINVFYRCCAQLVLDPLSHVPGLWRICCPIQGYLHCSQGRARLYSKKCTWPAMPPPLDEMCMPNRARLYWKKCACPIVPASTRRDVHGHACRPRSTTCACPFVPVSTRWTEVSAMMILSTMLSTMNTPTRYLMMRSPPSSPTAYVPTVLIVTACQMYSNTNNIDSGRTPT